MQRVGVLVELPGALRAMGFDPSPLLRAANVHPDLLLDVDSFLTFEQFSDLLQECAVATGRDDIFIRIGAMARPRHLSVLGRYMRAASTLEVAIDDFVENHRRFVRGGYTYLLRHENGDLAVCYRTYDPSARAARHIARGAIAFGYSVFRDLGGVAPANVQFSLPQPEDLRPYREVFEGAKLVFNAEHFSLVFRKGDLKTAIPTADPALRQQLALGIAKLWATQQPDIRDRVLRVLVPAVLSGTHSLESTAARLSMTPTALTRALNEQNCSFRDLLNQARFDMASQLLIDARMSVERIAVLMGYSEVSAFNRFFAGMCGAPPAKWRNEHSENASTPIVGVVKAR